MQLLHVLHSAAIISLRRLHVMSHLTRKADALVVRGSHERNYHNILSFVVTETCGRYVQPVQPFEVTVALYQYSGVTTA